MSTMSTMINKLRNNGDEFRRCLHPAASLGPWPIPVTMPTSVTRRLAMIFERHPGDWSGGPDRK
jgi:hypothetical protein